MSAAGDTSRLLLVGRVGAAHGIRGEVRLQSFTEDPLAIASYGPLTTDRDGLTLSIASVRRGAEGMLVVRLEGINERTAAEALKGLRLFVPRARLPEPETPDEFYHTDLIGLDARLADGTFLGKVKAMPNYGAGDLIEIADPRGSDTFLFPFTLKVVPEIHIAEGYLVIAPPLDADPGEEEPD